MSAPLVQHCHKVLVLEVGNATERSFADTPPEEFNAAFLISVGISAKAKGLQITLLSLRRKLHAKYHTPTLSVPVSENAAAAFTADEKAFLLQMQNTIQDLTSQLSKLCASTGNPSSSAPNSSTNDSRSGSGRGGMTLQQAQATANAINPRTELPYTMNDLSEEILRLQKEVAQTNRDIGNVAAATKEGFEDIHNSSTETEKKDQKKKYGWSMFSFN